MGIRVDSQITGLAGELFVAAELLKRGLHPNPLRGISRSGPKSKAKSINALFGHHPGWNLS